MANFFPISFLAAENALGIFGCEIIPFVNGFLNVYIQPLGYDRLITLSVTFSRGEPPAPD